MRNRVIVAGAFDDLRSRQIRFLQEAANLVELTVLLWSDETLHDSKKAPPQFPLEERKYVLEALRFGGSVKVVPPVDDAHRLPDLAGLEPRIWAVPQAQHSPLQEAFCQQRGLEYRVLWDEMLRGFPEASSGGSWVGGNAPSSSRKKVLVTGCYDWFHSGHVRFFEEVSAYGDVYVVVGRDANIRLLKGAGHPLYPQDERRYMVQSIRFVKQALISTGQGWLDAEPEIERLQPNIYAVNEDGDRPEKRDYCQRHGIQYLVLQRTPAQGLPKRSSTDLRGF